MEISPSLLSAGLVLVFSTVAVGFYLISDYYMDNGFPSAFGQACGDRIQDDCAYINSHLNSFGLADYDSDNDCRVILDAGRQRDARYKLHWKRFKLEGSTNCTNDYLELYEATDTSLVLDGTSGRFCGHDDPQFNITRQYVVLKFVTDGSDEDDGFRLLATRTLPAPCFDDYFHCKAENRCIDGRLHCDGTPQCDDESDEDDCSSWEKLIGGFLALGVAGIVGVVSLCVVGCTTICVTVCICTCCKERCGCLFKGCSRCWGTICSPCTSRIKKGTVEPTDDTAVQNISQNTDCKEKEQMSPTEGDDVDVTPAPKSGQLSKNNAV